MDWRRIQSEASSLLDDLGFTYDKLGDDELIKFNRSFERQFVLAFSDREIVDIYQRHVVEFMSGAMVAKKQMSAEMDGEQPGAGKVGGPLAIRAAWLGIGNDWEDVGDSGTFTPGSTPVDWIHSGTPLMGGTDGNAVKIGQNQVTVVVAIGTKHPSPKIESIQFTVDGKPKPVVVTAFALKMPGQSLKIKELDNAYLFKEDTTILAKILATNKSSGATITSIADIPYLLGVSYIKEDQLRLHDPTAIPGTTPDVILTT